MKISPVFAGVALAGFCHAQSDESPVLAVSSDDSFNFDILTGMGQIANDGADTGPSLAVAKKIVPSNWTTYIDAWATWFSVSDYFRRADAYNRENWDDPRINEWWTEEMAVFDHAIAALPLPGKRIQMPPKDFTVEVWYPQQAENVNPPKQLPTLILGQRFDAAQEDLYATVVAPALARGWNVMSYEGPGQPTKAAFVDPHRLALFGNSLGGYLDPRAAAFEPRLSAFLLDGGVWDIYDGYKGHLTPDLAELLESGDQDAFDNKMNSLQSNPNATTELKRGILQGLWAFKTHSLYEFFQQTKNHTLKGGIADMI